MQFSAASGQVSTESTPATNSIKTFIYQLLIGNLICAYDIDRCRPESDRRPSKEQEQEQVGNGLVADSCAVRIAG